MSEDEAKKILKEHLFRPSSNTKQLIDAIEIALKVLGNDATIDDVYAWAKN
jgi:hypothetical protein